jgi:fucose 4-O-acetylase-like acetyltransferase
MPASLMSQSDQKLRTKALDIARGLGILLVVYAHVARGLVGAGLNFNPALHSLVDSVIYSFHMPLFFFISGSLFPGSFERLGASGLLRSRIALILYPYLVWSLLQGGIEVVLSRYTNGTTTIADVLGLLWQPRAHFWFLYELFAIILAAVLLYRPAFGGTRGLVLGFALILYFSGFSPVDLFVTNSFGPWFVFFALGVSLNTAVLRPWTRPALIFAVALFVFVALEWIFHVQLGLRTGDAGPFARFPLALAGIGVILGLGQVLARWGPIWLEYVGRNAMEIYLVHILAGSGIRIFLQRGLGIGDPDVHLVAGAVGGVLVPLALAAIAHRSPWLGWLFVLPQPWFARAGIGNVKP